ncbi:MAG: hypothetical protein K5989_02005 [Lachnospiraceae bacterium]|nr:hypothetical protein [Lachnospiraceae bacterium]
MKSFRSKWKHAVHEVLGEDPGKSLRFRVTIAYGCFQNNDFSYYNK